MVPHPHVTMESSVIAPEEGVSLYVANGSQEVSVASLTPVNAKQHPGSLADLQNMLDELAIIVLPLSGPELAHAHEHISRCLATIQQRCSSFTSQVSALTTESSPSTWMSKARTLKADCYGRRPISDSEFILLAEHLLVPVTEQEVLVRYACTGDVLLRLKPPQKENTVARQIAASLDVKDYREQG
jgi:hypothetical protein